MYKKLFSNTRRLINPLGFGAGIGGYNKKANYNEKKFHNILDICFDQKVEIIDTSPVYGNGLSEKFIGSFNKRKKEKFFLATKVLPEMCSYKNVFKSIEKSMRRLKVDYIDLIQIHWPNPAISFIETLDAMYELKNKKLVKHIGLCNFSFNEFKKISKYYKKEHIDTIQLEYNLFERSIEKNFIPYCIKNKISVFAYSPLAQGKLANGSKQIDLINSIAQKNNKTASQIVLSWLIKNKNVFAIPNTTNKSNILENTKASTNLIKKNDFNQISKKCSTKVKRVDTKLVFMSKNKVIFKNLNDAKKNTLNFSPSPIELSKEIKKGIFLKPIRLRRCRYKKYLYELSEGGLRYWSWIIAKGQSKKIPALILNK